MIINPTNDRIDRRDEMLQYVKDKKYSRVLDCGGSMYPWARSVVTHYFDMLNPYEYHTDPAIRDEDLKRSTTFVGNLCSQKDWDVFLAKEKKFDFAICTQTLEDIGNPMIVLDNLPKIAKEGYIDIPSKWHELCLRTEGYGPVEQEQWGTNGEYRGYMHHRWVFSVQDEELVLFPKLNFLDRVVGLDIFTEEEKNKHQSLCFFWKDDIPYHIINNDWLGPNPPGVIDFYLEGLKKGL